MGLKALRNSRSIVDVGFLTEERLHSEGKLMRIAPSREVTVSRLERDMEKLGDLYWLGYNDGMERLPEIRSYLGVR